MRRLTMIILVFGILCATVSAGTILSPGISTGVFFAPNPGGVYLAPVTTGLDLRLAIGTRMAFLAGGLVEVHPFVPLDTTFGRSLMMTGEGYVGAGIIVPVLMDGRFTAGLLAGGGGYYRSIEGDRAAQISRRPYLAAHVVAGIGSGRWDYTLNIRYRLLFESEFIHTVEPALLVSFRVPVAGGAE